MHAGGDDRSPLAGLSGQPLSVVAKWVEWIKMPLAMEVGLGPGDIVLDGDPVGTQLPPQKKGHSRPQFSARVYCGQTAVCIRIPLDMEIDLSQSNIVFDAHPVPPSQGADPQFSANICCGQMPGWIKMLLGKLVQR